MKNILLALCVWNADVCCVGRSSVYIDVVHVNVEGNIVVKVAPCDGNVKLIDHKLREQDQLNLVDEDDAIKIVVANANDGTIYMSLMGDPVDSLLSFRVQKSNHHTPANVSLVNVCEGFMAALYRPSMGGGDSFVLALGHKESDVSVSTVRQTQSWGHLQMYFPVSSMSGAIVDSKLLG